jgi:hypothetical protein
MIGLPPDERYRANVRAEVVKVHLDAVLHVEILKGM